MTTAYAECAPQYQAPPLAVGNLRLVPNTAPAQGREGMKVRDVVLAFDRGTARGQGLESAQLNARLKKLQLELTDHVEALSTLLLEQMTGSYNYNAMPMKPVFSVQANYKFIGKLKPMPFVLDDE